MHGDHAVRCKSIGKQSSGLSKCEFKQTESSDECLQFAVKNVPKLNKCQIAWPSIAIGGKHARDIHPVKSLRQWQKEWAECKKNPDGSVDVD